MDPRGKAPVAIELNPTLAELLARLCVELDTDDYTGVLSRALGLHEMAQRTRRQGGVELDRDAASSLGIQRRLSS